MLLRTDLSKPQRGGKHGSAIFLQRFFVAVALDCSFGWPSTTSAPVPGTSGAN